MHFIDYLIEKKIISENDFVESFIDALEQMPSLIRLLHSNKSVSQSVLLDVIKQQILTGQGIKDIIVSKKIVSEQHLKELVNNYSEKSESVTEIMIEKGILDINKYNEVKADFLKLSGDNVKADSFEILIDNRSPKLDRDNFTAIIPNTENVASAIRHLSEGPETEGEVEISAAAMESLRELAGTGGLDQSVVDQLSTKDSIINKEPDLSAKGENADEGIINAAALESLRELVGSGKVDSETMNVLNSSRHNVEESAQVSSTVNSDSDFQESNIFLDEYLLKCSDRNMKKLRKIIAYVYTASMNNSDVLNIFNSFYSEIHVLLGNAKMADLKLITKFLMALDEFCESILINKCQNFLADHVKQEQNLFYGSLDVIENIHSVIAQGIPEVDVWKDAVVKEKYSKLYREIKKLHIELREE